MPLPGFLASVADKAQSAINASPLAAHLPSHRPSSPDPATQPTANQAAAQGGQKSHTFEALSHQFRAFQQQYSTTTPVQKIVTTEKGVSLDFESVARDSKAQSKELYTWGQSEADDLKDVTDRLAYLNFVKGSLAASLSAKLDKSRSSLKALRDAETALAPRRNIRAGFQSQIARIEHEQVRGSEKKLAELREQLRKAEMDDAQQERDIEILKRKGIRESEQIKWDAIREYGEKLVLLAQAASPIISVLPAVPPTPNTPYQGAQTTGAVRASLQRALDNYITGHIHLPPQSAGADLSRSDTRSFGESHASELSSINSEVASHSVRHTPPHGAHVPQALESTAASSVTKPLPVNPPSSYHPPAHESSSPPINPQSLNQNPAPIPTHITSPIAPQPVLPDSTAAVPPGITPTVAETGIPVSAGPGGPGPASGSLHDIKAASTDAGPRSGGLPGSAGAPEYGQAAPGFPVPTANQHESAEEEKRRLAALYSQPPPPAAADPGPSPAPPAATHHETAEEEKKRLEREERERILHAGGSTQNRPPNKNNDNDDLPPYQEPGLM